MYYTYAYLRLDGTPYYVGKGKGNRVYEAHNVAVPPTDRILYLKQNLTEEEAHKHEIYMISVLGRKDIGTGILRNLTDGGEGVSGYVTSEETKEKIRQKQLGKKMSAESSRKKSEATKGKWNGGGRMGQTVSEETKRKISQAMKGKKNFAGKKHTEEAKKKITGRPKKLNTIHSTK